MGKRLKNNKSGITLIALVVTIIVLMILAGTSISMLTGDNRNIN
jgi:type II secretory pathway pseudopilin PulG